MYGNKVTVTFADSSIEVYRNVTEIHYRWPRSDERADSVAFESDIHGTGCTYELYYGHLPFPARGGVFRLAVVEFCVVPETEIQEEF